MAPLQGRAAAEAGGACDPRGFVVGMPPAAGIVAAFDLRRFGMSAGSSSVRLHQRSFARKARISAAVPTDFAAPPSDASAYTTCTGEQRTLAQPFSAAAQNEPNRSDLPVISELLD